MTLPNGCFISRGVIVCGNNEPSVQLIAANLVMVLVTSVAAILVCLVVNWVLTHKKKNQK